MKTTNVLSLIVLVLTTLWLPVVSRAQSGSNDGTFNPGDNGRGAGPNTTIPAMIVQTDGKIIIGGNFTKYNSTDVNRIARINTDGSYDATFTKGDGFNGAVTAIARQSDDKIIVAGSFTSYNSQAIDRIARLNTDGTLDGTFTPGASYADVKSISIQGDGKIVIAGSFTPNRIARLNTNGTTDGTFVPGTGADNAINSVVVQSDGKIVIGGTFANYNGTARNRVARLTSTGALDTAFDPGIGPDNNINVVAVQTDGRVLIGGTFTTFSSTARRQLARLTTTGTLDATFTPDIITMSSAVVNSIVVQSDGLIVIGGFFTVNGSSANHFDRLNANGTLDDTLVRGSGADNTVNVVAIKSDGSFVLAGAFQSFASTFKIYVAQVLSDGNIDTTFNPVTGLLGPVNVIVQQPDGKILVGGNFAIYNNELRRNIMRLNADGSLDASSVGSLGGATSVVTAIALQSDGKIIIGGNFGTYQGSSRNRIARLNTNGTNDATFTPGTGANNNITAVAIQSDGKIIISGSFTSYNGTAISRIARLNSNGTLDATFNPGAGPSTGAKAIAIQSDGKIIIGGGFTTYDGVSKNGIARLNTDGSLDAPFGGTGTGVINAITIQPDNQILIAGIFATYNGTAANGIVRLNTDGTLDPSFSSGSGVGAGEILSLSLASNNKIAIGGSFTVYNGTTRNKIAMLNTSGSLDTSFDPGSGTGTGPGAINAVAVQSDGNVMLGGGFTEYYGVPRSRIARAIVLSCATPPTPGTIGGTATICASTSNTYSITAVGGATSYTWTLPSGWTGTSTTTSINTTAGTTGGNITVTANNACGSSAASVLAVTVNSSGPAQPGTITGDATLCSGASETYSIAAVSGATSYTWTLPGGWTGTSTTTSINATASATSGNISVVANGNCGSSTARTLAVTVSTGVPAQPSVVSGDAAVCSGATETYSVTAVSGATSYTWTLPSGWTGTSTTNSISVTAGAAGGNISVTANNICGASTARTLAVTVSATPAQPGTIGGDIAVCSATSETYSVTAVSGATSYTWTLPSGWTGTSTTNSITVTTGTTSGNISVTANNTCGTSTARTLAVTVTAVPTQPGTITGDVTTCSGTAKTYSVTAVAGATSYTWTLPGGWTGTSTTNSITATASATSGNISVTANNACGSSTARTLAVTVTTTPAQPGTITGDAAICSGTTRTYSITAVANATSYTWTLPGGWTGASTTNSIAATASTTSGNISVTASNTCGTSAARTLAVTAKQTPAKPVISVNDANPQALILSTTTADSYAWFQDGDAAGTSATIEVSTSGDYTVKVTTNGCESVLSDPKTIVITGINDEQLRAMNIFPNPVSEWLVISLDGIPGKKTISVYDVNGKKPLTAEVETSDTQAKLNVRDYATGIYLVKVKTDRLVKVMRFSKE